VSNYRDRAGEEYEIVLRMPVDNQVYLEDIQKIYVKSLTGEMIPVRQLISVEFKEAPGIVSHYNMSRDATITGDIEKGYQLDDIIEELDVKISSFDWPNGYTYKYTGELESREESFGGMARASIIAVLAIFAILVLQFGSFMQPLIIFSAIPLALIGSTIALFITGYTFSFTAFIGLISLIGIVVNNSIILVDYANILQKEGKSIKEALIVAGETRFTPIVLTTLTTIGGLLPLTLRGGTLWAPMGWTIIGGLLVSTFLTLVVVPVLYSLLTSRKELTLRK
jgi:multidrug efflux pump subunit AcrB